MAQHQFEHYHPLFRRRAEDWAVLADCHEGETRVKSRGPLYLPVTSGQHELGMGTTGNGAKKPGQLLYDAYLTRAIFPDVVRATVSSLVGLMMREPWTITLPSSLDGFMETASDRGESLEAFVDNLLEKIILNGRAGVLLDVDESRDLPYLVRYDAGQIINWDDTPEGSSTIRRTRMVTLDETQYARSGSSLTWQEEKVFRLLTMDEGGAYTVQVERGGATLQPVTPAIQGDRLDSIPFQFFGATDHLPEPGEVPMIGLARLALAIYRGEADYRHSLFMQGQDTLVLVGVPNPGLEDFSRIEDHVGLEDQLGRQQTGSKVVVGAGAVIYLPDDSQDAKFIGVSSTGLAEQRSALENDYDRASQFGMTLLTSGSSAEAADTLRTRVAGRTASLASIAKTTAQGLERVLRLAATWSGGNPDEVKVEPNLDFVDDPMAPQELKDLVEAKIRGARISWETIHEQVQRRGLSSVSYEEELERIDNEGDALVSENEDLGEEDEPIPPSAPDDDNAGGE